MATIGSPATQPAVKKGILHIQNMKSMRASPTWIAKAIPLRDQMAANAMRE